MKPALNIYKHRIKHVKVLLCKNHLCKVCSNVALAHFICWNKNQCSVFENTFKHTAHFIK